MCFSTKGVGMLDSFVSQLCSGFTQEKWPRPKGFAAEGHWFFVQMQAEENILPEDPEEHLDLGEISAILRQTAT